MKKVFVLLLIIIIPGIVYAGRGCCSHHGGECGCSSYGRSICCDGTFSPTCTCIPQEIYGCMDKDAINYNSDAINDDGSCKYVVGSLDDTTNSDSQNNNTNEEKEINYKEIKEDKNDFNGIIPTLLLVGGFGYAIGAYNNKKK